MTQLKVISQTDELQQLLTPVFSSGFANIQLKSESLLFSTPWALGMRWGNEAPSPNALIISKNVEKSDINNHIHLVRGCHPRTWPPKAPWLLGDSPTWAPLLVEAAHGGQVPDTFSDERTMLPKLLLPLKPASLISQSKQKCHLTSFQVMPG